MSEKRSGLGKGLGALIPAEHPRDLEYIPLNMIKPNPHQPRSHFPTEALKSLINSIKAVGVLQPILVQPEGNEYRLIAGERRWRASQEAGLKEIPALVRESDDQNALTSALVENMQRQDLGPLEEAAAFAQLQDDFGMTHAQIGEQVGRSRAAVTNAIRLLQLGPFVQAALVAGDLSVGHARALLSVDNEEREERLARRAIKQGWSVRKLEETIKSDDSSAVSRLQQEMRPAPIIELEKALADQLGIWVRIQYKGDKGQVVLKFSSLDQLENIYRKFFPNNQG